MYIKFLVENERGERIIYGLLLKMSLVKDKLYSYLFTKELLSPLLFYLKKLHSVYFYRPHKCFHRCFVCSRGAGVSGQRGVGVWLGVCVCSEGEDMANAVVVTHPTEMHSRFKKMSFCASRMEIQVSQFSLS